MPDRPQTFPSFAEPSHEDIARRACEIYRAADCENGHDVDHWLQAERELRAAQEPRAVAKADRRRQAIKAVRTDKRAKHAAMDEGG